jgi:hypothetical protein
MITHLDSLLQGKYFGEFVLCIVHLITTAHIVMIRCQQRLKLP